MLLGLAVAGCPGGKSSQGATGSTDNGGGGSGGAAGSAGSGGAAGSGGQACQPMTEICDGKDNDCDGLVDNVPGAPPGGCQCTDGATQPCYSGPNNTQGIGVCAAGNQTCENGAWGACMGEVVPAAKEDCNLKDDDCNGVVDDMGKLSCGVGACAAMVDACANGQPQVCVPNQPTVEVCDGVDNNCNQLTDESDPMLDATCMTGLSGPCAVGHMKCTNQQLVCTADVMPTMEKCDGLDNDCNGTKDDNIPGTGGVCSTGALGVCDAGTISCGLQGGMYTVDCFQDVQGSSEKCDGLDNNCDGTTDENNPEGGGMCDTMLLGVCQAGTLNCVNGMVQCTQNAQSSAETCDGQDNNCDGQVDEGNPESGQTCGCGGSGVTACQSGVLVCNGGPPIYFQDDFKDTSKGWTLDSNWSIGPTVMSAANTSCGGGDPAMDHTPDTNDNGVAGNVLGGNISQTIGGPYYLTSPAFNTAQAPTVFFQYYRWLHSDYPSFMIDKVEVYDGSSWILLWQNPSGVVVNDTSWVYQSFDVTAHKNAQMRVRFSYQVGSGAYLCSGWNIDDVLVAAAACP